MSVIVHLLEPWIQYLTWKHSIRELYLSFPTYCIIQSYANERKMIHSDNIFPDICITNDRNFDKRWHGLPILLITLTVDWLFLDFVKIYFIHFVLLKCHSKLIATYWWTMKSKQLIKTTEVEFLIYFILRNFNN